MTLIPSNKHWLCYGHNTDTQVYYADLKSGAIEFRSPAATLNIDYPWIHTADELIRELADDGWPVCKRNLRVALRRLKKAAK